jgi:hypothetical protein
MGIASIILALSLGYYMIQRKPGAKKFIETDEG